MINCFEIALKIPGIIATLVCARIECVGCKAGTWNEENSYSLSSHYLPGTMVNASYTFLMNP